MASKFWVGGGTNTNWNASPTTNWANTSGGTGNQTAPATGDDVTFDNASGTTASVWQTTISLNSLKCSGSRNLVTHATVAITISGGDLELPGGVGSTYSTTSAVFTFTGTSGTQKITTNGKTLNGLTFNGIGGTFQLQDNANVNQAAASAVTLTNGTFDAQSFNLSTGSFVASAANVRTLIASGTWTVGVNNQTGTIFNLVTTSLTSTNFAPNITVASSTATAVRTLTLGGLATYGTLSIGANANGGSIVIGGANTFSNFAITGPAYVLFANSITQTITNAFAFAGTPGSPISLGSNAVNTQATLSVATGAPTFNWCGIRDLVCAGGATFTAANSFDQGHNSGVTITPPPAVAGKFVSAQRGSPY